MKANENLSLMVPYHSDLGLGTFHSDFDNLVDRLFSSFWQEPGFLRERNWRYSDITEDKDNYYIEIELAGFKKSEVSVSVQNNTVKVNAKNNKSVYSRQFNISGWDTNSIKSRLENGVLTLTISKTENAKEKFIDIEEVKEEKQIEDKQKETKK